MNTARRWYIYLVCAISLQGVTWAVITLLRNLLAGGGGGVPMIALQIATIIISLPLFLVHWLWAQRLTRRDIAERDAGLRGIYHYAMMGGFLGPVVANAFSLFAYIFWLAVGKPGYDPSYGYVVSPFEDILYNLIAIVVCALMWFYQQRVVIEDLKSKSENESIATMRRLYLFVFSAWGMMMTTMAVIHILRWIMYQFGQGSLVSSLDSGYLMDEVARLIVGLPLWLLFWRQAQSLFAGPGEVERQSALRKFYLYTTVFVAALTVVTNATFILAGLFRRVLVLPSSGDIRTPLPIIIGMALLWIYHAFELKKDASLTIESTKQGGVRRLYLYLIAAIGLAAFLVGFSGDISVLIRSFSQSFMGLKEALAWFTSALIAGLPVWFLPWRQAQLEAVSLTPDGAEMRRSSVRKIYLYFYLFVATMTVLSGAVYVLYRLLSLAFGVRGEGNLVSGIAQAIAYALVGVGVWIYHGSVLREDGNLFRRDRAVRLKDTSVVIIHAGDAAFGQALLKKMQEEEPDLSFNLFNLSEMDKSTLKSVPSKLKEAGVIIGPWSMAVNADTKNSDIVQALVKSPAHKILIPVAVEGWDLAGVDQWGVEGLLKQTVHAVKQWVDGKEVKAVRPMTIGGIIGTVAGVLILLILLAIPMVMYFSGYF